MMVEGDIVVATVRRAGAAAGAPGLRRSRGGTAVAARSRDSAVERAAIGSERGSRRPARTGRRVGGVLAAGFVLVAAGMVGATLGAAQVAHAALYVRRRPGCVGRRGAGLAGPAAACARAAEFIAHNDGRLTACTLDGLDLTVTASIPAAPAVLPGVAATATARLGRSGLTTPAAPGEGAGEDRAGTATAGGLWPPAGDGPGAQVGAWPPRVGALPAGRCGGQPRTATSRTVSVSRLRGGIGPVAVLAVRSAAAARPPPRPPPRSRARQSRGGALATGRWSLRCRPAG